MIPLARCCKSNPRYRVWARGRSSRFPLQIELGAYDSRSPRGAMQKAYRRGSWVPPGYKRVAVRENPLSLRYRDHLEGPKLTFIEDDQPVSIQAITARNPLPVMTNPPITKEERGAIHTAMGSLIHDIDTHPNWPESEKAGFRKALDLCRDVIDRHEIAGEVVAELPAKYRRRNPPITEDEHQALMAAVNHYNSLAAGGNTAYQFIAEKIADVDNRHQLTTGGVVDTIPIQHRRYRRNPDDRSVIQEAVDRAWGGSHRIRVDTGSGGSFHLGNGWNDFDQMKLEDILGPGYQIKNSYGYVNVKPVKKNPELLMVGMAAMNPGGKIRLKDVKQAEREYASAMTAWGENNMVTQRAMSKWYDLRAAYAQQTGKSVNPKRRGSMRHRRIRVRVKHRRRNSRRRARGFTRKVRFHGKLLTGFQIQKKYGKTAARRALGINPGRKHGRRRRGRRC